MKAVDWGWRLCWGCHKQERAQLWNTESLLPDLEASGSLPTLVKNTLWLRGKALSAVGRPDMEKEWGRGGRRNLCAHPVL